MIFALGSGNVGVFLGQNCYVKSQNVGGYALKLNAFAVVEIQVDIRFEVAERYRKVYGGSVAVVGQSRVV